MSDDVIGTNLEDDGPAIEAPAPVAAAPVAAPEAPPPPADDAPDVESVDVGGQRLVPLSALLTERREKQTLKEQAGRVAELEQWRRDNEPYVQFLQNNRELLIQRVQPEPAPRAPAAPAVDPDALEAARLMDFYRADGQPDVEKGARWLALQDKRSGRIADERVQPMRERTQHEQASINFQRALQIKDANGESPSRESVEAIFRQMPPELAADERVSMVLTLAAMGADRMKTPRKAVVAPPSAPPLITETSGGNPRTRPTLTPLEERIASDRGISATKWQEHTRGYQPGRPTQLED